MNQNKTDNFMMRIYLETIQSIVGENGLKSVLNYGNLEKYIDNIPPDNDELEIPVEEVRALFLSLYELFGRKGVRGLQLRAGREISRLGIERRSRLVKAVCVAVRFLPEVKKIQVILERVAEQTRKMYTVELREPLVEVKEEEDSFLLIYRDRFESKGVVSTMPVCNVFVGMLQYFIEWVTGHRHEVEEIECRAMGHPADVFKVSKPRKE
jgi:predicted hydrocarbon binding protein